MSVCSSCGTSIHEGDLFCRSCGATIVAERDARVDSGRALVIVSAVILLALHAFSTLFGLTVAAMSLTPPVDLVGTVVTATVEVVLLYLVYRGYPWARLVTGLLVMLGAIVGSSPSLRSSDR
jgi:hypothetical protein